MSGVPVNSDGNWQESKPFVNVGGSWKEVEGGFALSQGKWTQFYQNVQPTFIAILGNGKSAISADGLQWKYGESLGDAFFSNTFFLGGKVFAYAYGPEIVESKDGLSWNKVDVPSNVGQLQVYSPGMDVAIFVDKDASTHKYTSIHVFNGENFLELPNAPTVHDLNDGIALPNGDLLILGQKTTYVTRYDTANKTLYASQPFPETLSSLFRKPFPYWDVKLNRACALQYYSPGLGQRPVTAIAESNGDPFASNSWSRLADCSDSFSDIQSAANIGDRSVIAGNNSFVLSGNANSFEKVDFTPETGYVNNSSKVAASPDRAIWLSDKGKYMHSTDGKNWNLSTALESDKPRVSSLSFGFLG